MRDCRYYDMCFRTDDSCNGYQECPKREFCGFYSPMPDIGALSALANELENAIYFECDERAEKYLMPFVDRIREAVGA